MLLTGSIVMTIGVGAPGIWLHIGTDDAVMLLSAVAMLLTSMIGFGIIEFGMSAGPLITGRPFGIAASTFTNSVANFSVTLFVVPEPKGVSPASHFVA